MRKRSSHFGPALAGLAVILVFLDGEDLEVGAALRGGGGGTWMRSRGGLGMRADFQRDWTY